MFAVTISTPKSLREVQGTPKAIKGSEHLRQVGELVVDIADIVVVCNGGTTWISTAVHKQFIAESITEQKDGKLLMKLQDGSQALLVRGILPYEIANLAAAEVSEEEEEEAPVAKKKPGRPAKAKVVEEDEIEEDEIEEEEEEDEEPVVKKKPGRPAKAAAKPTPKKPVKKVVEEDEEEEEEIEEDEEEEEPAPKKSAKKPAPKKPVKKVVEEDEEEEEEDEDFSDDEEEEEPAPKKSAKKPAPKKASLDDEDGDDVWGD